jgi:hypothetical protein
MPAMWVRRALVGAVILLLPGLMLLPAWRLHGLGAGEDDLLYYLPVRTLVHDAAATGQWPWLNSWTGLGRPLAADPQAALWYPGTWLFALLQPLTAYAASLWLHYSLALWGMYRLLRSLKFDRVAAVFGGIAFAFCGFMLAHRVHFTMQHAAAWLPWVLWRLHVYALTPTAHVGHLRRLAFVALAALLQCLAGHIQIVAITGLGSLVYLLAHAARSVPLRVRLLRWCLTWLATAGLFAVQWLPTLAYAQHCTRMHRTYRDFVENSWHPASVVMWGLPMLFGQRTPNFFPGAYWGPSHQVEQFAYAGLTVLLLAALALRCSAWRNRDKRPWAVLGVFGLLWALGLYGPICPVLYWLPGADILRAPARALLLVNLAIAVLAAGALHELGRPFTPTRVHVRAALIAWTRRARLSWLSLIGGASLALTTLLWWQPAIWVPALLAVLSGLVAAVVVRLWQWTAARTALVALTVLDLAIIGWTLDVPANIRSAKQMLDPGPSTAWQSRVRDSGERLWVVAGRINGVPGEYIRSIEKAVANACLLQRISSLTDYGPLQPQGFAERFAFKPWGESDRAAELLANPSWLPAYGVGWVLICDRPDIRPALPLATETPQGWRLYRVPPGPPAFLINSFGEVQVTDQTNTTVTLETTLTPTAQPRYTLPRLVISRLWLPGWHARLDGQPAAVERYDDVLLAIPLPPDYRGTITLHYTPPWLRAGAIVSLICGIVLACGVLLEYLNATRKRPPAAA